MKGKYNMVQRKAVAKKGAKASGGAVDFESFMGNLINSGAITDITGRPEIFYKFGDYNLDRALGGGLPSGQIYAFQGPSSSGKSLAALEISRSVIEQGKRVAYFDTENKISAKALRMMGLADTNGMFSILTLDNLEDALDTLMKMAESDLFGLVVIDSTDALVTDEQEERDIHEGSKVGGYKAKVFSEWMGKVSSLAAAHDCSILLVRQIRDSMNMYGPSETTSGGRAVEFYATTILRFGPNKAGNSDEDGKLAYQGANVTIKKMNQGAAPKDPLPIRFYIGDNHDWGIDKLGSIFDEAKALGVLAPATATSHKYVPCDALCKELGVTPEEISFNGANNVRAAIEADEAFREALKKVIADCDGVPVGDEEEEVDFEELDD